MKLNPKAIESWLNDVLAKGEDNKELYGYPFKLVLADRKRAIERFSLDWETMQLHGISKETTFRIYRSLFVYATGFHEMLQELLKGKKEIYIGAIWLVYIHLLEKCQETGYKSALRSITEAHTEEIKVKDAAR